MVWAQMLVAKPLIETHETLDPLSVLLYDSQEALSLLLPQSLPVSVMLDQLDTGVAIFPKHLITVILISRCSGWRAPQIIKIVQDLIGSTLKSMTTQHDCSFVIYTS